MSKANERAVNRRNNVRFNPKATINILSQGEPPDELDDDQKRELVQKYIEVSHRSTQHTELIQIHLGRIEVYDP